jgi:hypothetical protein
MASCKSFFPEMSRTSSSESLIKSDFEMKSLENSGIDGLYVEFEENMEEDYDGYTNYYTDIKIYGDKKYAQDKLDKRKIEIESEIENYNKRIEEYKEKLKLEVLRES